MTKRAPAVKRLGRPPAAEAGDTRRRILDSARRSFADRGFAAATNRELGAEVGITAGAIYHYFGSKLDLYRAVYDDVQRLVLGRLAEAVARADTFQGQFDSVLDEVVRLNEEDPTLARFMASVRVDMRRDAELGAALADQAQAGHQFFDDLVAVGLETGEIHPSDGPAVRAVVTTVLVGLNDAVSDEPALHRRAVEGIKALLHRSLVTPAA